MYANAQRYITNVDTNSWFSVWRAILTCNRYGRLQLVRCVSGHYSTCLRSAAEVTFGHRAVFQGWFQRDLTKIFVAEKYEYLIRQGGCTLGLSISEGGLHMQVHRWSGFPVSAFVPCYR